MRIYLDHNAGTPIRPEARAAIERCLGEDGANPASVHRGGQRARAALEGARARVARIIGAAAREISFTSGGTESNNLAIRGALAAAGGARRRIVSSAIEHSSILAPLEYFAGAGYEAVLIAPDRDGRIATDRVIEAINADTALVTLGLANAEVGSILDCAPIAVAAANAGATFHLDAAQAVGRIPVRVAELGCGLMTISGHKLGAPAGIGALYVRDGVVIEASMLGGPQESGLRAGTPNLIGAVAIGAAADAAAARMGEEGERIERLAHRLLERLSDEIEGMQINGPDRGGLANTLNLAFPGVLGENMLIALDLEGVEVSMGSACAAGSVEPSHVLLAMGIGREKARSSLRISLGWNTDADEIERAAEIIARVWRRVVSAERADAAIASPMAATDAGAPR